MKFIFGRRTISSERSARAILLIPLGWSLICLFGGNLYAGDMTDTVKIEAGDTKTFHTMFGSYGYSPQRSIAYPAGAVRFRLPAGVNKLPQTGLYSLFTLAGDCEVTCRFELLNVPAPNSGYGCGIGVGLDLGDDDGRGTIQRMIRLKNDNVFILQTSMYGSGTKREEADKTVPAAGKRGWIGLRRVKNELIFLASDSWTESPREIERLPFGTRAIQAVRFYADSGGSPTAVEARLFDITIQAEEITGAVPRSEQASSRWWLWGLLCLSIGTLGFLRWRGQR